MHGSPQISLKHFAHNIKILYYDHFVVFSNTLRQVCSLGTYVCLHTCTCTYVYLATGSRVRRPTLHLTLTLTLSLRRGLYTRTCTYVYTYVECCEMNSAAAALLSLSLAAGRDSPDDKAHVLVLPRHVRVAAQARSCACGHILL